MVNFKATKNLDINAIRAVLTVQVKQKRPDIVWLLRNLNKWGMSSAETKNLMDYLTYLHLIRNNELSTTGERALETNNVLIPETGVYDIYYVQDKVFGNKIIDFERIRADRDIIGSVEEFREYELFDQKMFEKWSTKHTEFHVTFEKRQTHNPRVIRRGSLKSQLTINLSGDNVKLNIQSKNGKYKRIEDDSRGFLLDTNLAQVIRNWDIDTQSKLVSFEDVDQHPVKLNSFKDSEKVSGQNIIFTWGIDEGSYDVEINDIPIIPISDEDARKWILTLLETRLLDEECYFTERYIEDIEKKILKETPIKKKYPSLFIDVQLFKEILKNELSKLDLFRKIQVAEDLS